jgi:RNA polymerase sigma-70 factor, ECF subfamily
MDKKSGSGHTHLTPAWKEDSSNDEDLLYFNNYRNHGCERSFTKLYKKHERWIHAHVYAALGDEERSKEIVQDLFLRITRHINSFDPSRLKFTTWLVVILKNLIKNEWRKKAREKKTFVYFDGEIRNTKYHGQDVELALEMEEVERGIDKAMLLLSDTHRLTLIAALRHELTHEEIARRSGCPVATSKSRLHHAKKLLRKAASSQPLITEASRWTPIKEMEVSRP